MHMGFKTLAKLAGLSLGIIYTILDVIFKWVPAEVLRLEVIASTLGGFVVLTVIIPIVVYVSDYIHVLFHAAKETATT